MARYFVTGASGWIGTALIPDLVAHGHSVLGLVRSDEGAARAEAAGADVLRGNLDDLDSLRAGAEQADGVIHLAFKHDDFTQMAAAAASDRAAIDLFGDLLADTGKPFVIASGSLGVTHPGGGPATEEDPVPEIPGFDRPLNAIATLKLADRGVRSSVVRLPPSVHGRGDKGFVPWIISCAREHGRSAYVGDGANRWPSTHVSDAARVFRLAADEAQPGSILHPIHDTGVPIKDIATVIGRHLDVPVESIPADRAAEHFAWMAGFIGFDNPMSSEITRTTYNWTPTGPTLIDDLEAGHYFEV
jgi:nucleoside-diphosphate-sugar epimerase